MKPRIFLVVLCGAADRPIAALGDRTPMEVARLDHLNRLARDGTLGLLTIINPEISPETDSGIMALLGYDPLRYYTGRGALEAFGMGFMHEGGNAVGFRINFGHFDDAAGRLDRRTARDLSHEEQQCLVAELAAGVALAGASDVERSIVGFGRHRGIVCFRSSEALSANVSNTDPGFTRIGPFGVPTASPAAAPLRCVPLDSSAAAQRTADLVNRYVEEARVILSCSAVNRRRQDRGALAANILLFRDAGSLVPSLEAFAARWNRTLALYGQVPAERGLCTLLGARWIEARQGAHEEAVDYYRRLLAVVAEDDSDVVVIHLKAADEPGHDGQVPEKIRALEEIDRLCIGPLVALGTSRDIYIVTSDHATPCELGIHSADRVPVVVSGGGIAADAASVFCEREAATVGGLDVDQACYLFGRVLQLAQDATINAYR